MRSADAITTLEELGSGQCGLITTGQAESFGVSRVHRVRRGFYSLPSAKHGPLQDLRAAWLATSPRTLAEDRVTHGDDVMVSHLSAARAHGLGDLIPSVHEFTSPRRRQSTHTDVRFHQLDLPEEDRALVNGLPVTSVVRTVEDVAAAETDLDHLADVIHDALSMPEVHPGQLAKRLNRVAHRYDHRSGEALVDDCIDRSGLPAVAANLTGLSAFSSAVMKEGINRAVDIKISEHLRANFPQVKTLPPLRWRSDNTDPSLPPAGPPSDVEKSQS